MRHGLADGTRLFGKYGTFELQFLLELTTVDDTDLRNAAIIVRDYLDAMANRPGLPEENFEWVPVDEVAKLDEDVAYKFVPAKWLPEWKRGSFLLSPPAKFLDSENANANDTREGFGLSCFHDVSRSWVLAGRAFNSAILCTSGTVSETNHQILHEKFGSCLLKINRVSEFAKKIAKLTGAERWEIRDVTYSDSKAVKIRLEEGRRLNELVGLSEKLNQSHIPSGPALDQLIKLGEIASVFCKPSAYAVEQERRILFSYPTVVSSPLPVSDPTLWSEHIDLISEGWVLHGESAIPVPAAHVPNEMERMAIEDERNRQETSAAMLAALKVVHSGRVNSIETTAASGGGLGGYVVALLNPMPGQHYYSVECDNCHQPAALLEDRSQGRFSQPFSGSGTFIGECPNCRGLVVTKCSDAVSVKF